MTAFERYGVKTVKRPICGLLFPRTHTLRLSIVNYIGYTIPLLQSYNKDLYSRILTVIACICWASTLDSYIVDTRICNYVNLASKVCCITCADGSALFSASLSPKASIISRSCCMKWAHKRHVSTFPCMALKYTTVRDTENWILSADERVDYLHISMLLFACFHTDN